jgi:RES domain
VPRQPPPGAIDRRPHSLLLPARTKLWRVHSAKQPVYEFRPVALPGPFGGGRFDGIGTDSYPCLYAAEQQTTALAESLLTGVQFDGRGNRIIRRVSTRGRRLSAFETTEELRLVLLVSAVDLAAVGQDDWLVQAEPRDFELTREWGGWLRTIDPSAQGLVWQSRRDRPHRSIVLFGDRCPAGCLDPSPLPPVKLDSPDGTGWLQQQLRPYRMSIEVVP